MLTNKLRPHQRNIMGKNRDHKKKRERKNKKKEKKFKNHYWLKCRE